jgi:hypothetical protein
MTTTPTWKEKEHPPVPNTEILQMLPLDDLCKSKRRKGWVVQHWWHLPKEVLLLVAKLVVKVVAVLLVVVVATKVVRLLPLAGVAPLLQFVVVAEAVLAVAQDSSGQNWSISMKWWSVFCLWDLTNMKWSPCNICGAVPSAQLVHCQLKKEVLGRVLPSTANWGSNMSSLHCKCKDNPAFD